MNPANSTAHRIVSSESDQLILVDTNDRPVGSASKAQCHDGDGQLHRAFSVFLFDDEGRVLLQQRGSDKRLWPGYWSNACCSHPRLGESLTEATKRRLDDELNVAAELSFIYSFRYQASYRDEGSEHEYCHVFVGRVAGDVTPNASEISAVRFLHVADLARELDEMPDTFTPWFKLEWQALCGKYKQQLERFWGRAAD